MLTDAARRLKPASTFGCPRTLALLPPWRLRLRWAILRSTFGRTLRYAAFAETAGSRQEIALALSDHLEIEFGLIHIISTRHAHLAERLHPRRLHPQRLHPRRLRHRHRSDPG